MLELLGHFMENVKKIEVEFLCPMFTWGDQTKMSSSKMQHNAENACGSGMCERAHKKLYLSLKKRMQKNLFYQ